MPSLKKFNKSASVTRNLEKKNKKNINNAHNILHKKVWGDTMRI